MPIRHVVSVPDQTHVADLLMKDVGKFPRDKEVLDKVSAISSGEVPELTEEAFKNLEVSQADLRTTYLHLISYD